MSIEELDALRRETVKKCNIRILIAILIIAVFVYVFVFVFSAGPFLLFPISIVMIVIGNMNTKIKKQYLNTFMQSLLPIAVQSILTDVKVDVTSGIPRYTIAETNSMSTGDIYNSSNYVSGVYKDIKVIMSDVHIQDEHEDSEGHTSYVTIFKGQWMIFDFNKNFKSNIQVWEKKILGGFSRVVTSKQHKIEMEDINFNKKFKVIAEDDLAAFYILTPKIMERITEVENAINGTLLLVFKDSKLHVGLYNNKTTFNINIRKKINFEEFARNSISDLDAIVKFVDILELDNDLFKVSEADIQKVAETPLPIKTMVSNVGLAEDVNNIVNNSSNNTVEEAKEVSAVEYFNNISNNQQ